MIPIGDSFIGWDYRGHNAVCKSHPLNKLKDISNHKKPNKMNARAKLVCTKVDSHFHNEEKQAEQVTFSTLYDTANSPEDNSFSKYTPSANFSFNVSNGTLFGAFEEGKAYYFDISPCE